MPSIFPTPMCDFGALISHICVDPCRRYRFQSILVQRSEIYVQSLTLRTGFDLVRYRACSVFPNLGSYRMRVFLWPPPGNPGVSPASRQSTPVSQVCRLIANIRNPLQRKRRSRNVVIGGGPLLRFDWSSQCVTLYTKVISHLEWRHARGRDKRSLVAAK